MSYMHHICGLKISIHAPRAGSDKIIPFIIYDNTYFNPRSPCGERLFNSFPQTLRENFNPRSPCGERLLRDSRTSAIRLNFNPRSPCGERPRVSWRLQHWQAFQSTLPVRGATRGRRKSGPCVDDFNPRSPCGERLRRRAGTAPWKRISIHAPRAGSDERPAKKPLSPCLFQSTLPVRGATRPRAEAQTNQNHFNPRSPCGERRQARGR